MTTEICVHDGHSFPPLRVTKWLPDLHIWSFFGAIDYANVFYYFSRVNIWNFNHAIFFLSINRLLLADLSFLSCLRHCNPGAPPASGVSWAYSPMLRCIAGFLHCAGFTMQNFSLPMCLLRCWPLRWVLVVVIVDIIVFRAGVSRNDSIVGWSTGSEGYLPWNRPFSSGVSVALFVLLASWLLRFALSIVQILPL